MTHLPYVPVTWEHKKIAKQLDIEYGHMFEYGIDEPGFIARLSTIDRGIEDYILWLESLQFEWGWR